MTEIRAFQAFQALSRAFTCLLFWLSSQSCLLAQSQTTQYNFNHFTTKDGLCHNRIRCVFEDDEGFLWIGTEFGISRFDGSQFTNYWPWPASTVGSSQNLVSSISQDKTGRIWFNQENGITCLDKANSSWHYFPLDTFPDGSENKLYFMGGRVFEDGKLRTVNYKTRTFWILDLFANTGQSYSLDSIFIHLTADSVRHLCLGLVEKKDHTWWLTTPEGYFHFNHDFSLIRFYPQASFCFAPLKSDDQYLYLTAWQHGYFRLDPGSGKIENWSLSKGKHALEDIINGIATIDANTKWIATEKGLYKYDELAGHVTLLSQGKNFRNGTVCYSLLKDSRGNIWVGSEFGLYQADPSTTGFQYVPVDLDPEYTYENPLFDIDEGDEPGQLYITSRGGEVVSLAGNQMEKVIADDSNPQFTQLHKDKKGQWWLLSRNDIYHFDPIHKTIIPVATPPRRENRGGLFWNIVEDEQGRLWIGISRDGIMYYDPAVQEFKYITCEQHQLCAYKIMELLLDHQRNRLWVATEGDGLWYTDLDEIQFHRYPLQSNDKNLDRLYDADLDDSGNLWIIALDCIIRLKPEENSPGNLIFIDVQDGLADPFLGGLIFDGKQHLWTSTSGTLISIHKQTLEITTYDHRYGVDISPLALTTFTKGKNGIMYAGGKSGLLAWDPSKLTQDLSFPTVYIDRVEIADDTAFIGQSAASFVSIRLRNNQNNLAIHFSAIDFTLPDKNQFTWTLQGYENIWRTGKGPATYTRIPPGKYLFKIAIKGHEDKAYAMNLYIVPAFWQTMIFKVLVGVILVLLAAAFYKWRVRLTREKELLRSQLTNRIAEVEMSALRAQINPHFIFNCLNSINRFIQINEPDTASLYLTKFARLIRLALDLSRENLVPLDKELELIKIYVEMENLRFNGRFNWTLDIDEDLDPSSIDIPPMIMQPYIENAIWHGLMNRNDNSGLLCITIKPEANDLIIRIEDNGVGRQIATALKSKNATKHKSFGMALTQERLELLEHQSGKKMKVLVEDLVLADGSPGGTAVVLRLSNYES